MVYIYRKRIGNKDYYYLRASVRQNNKTLTKDIAYLGSDASKIKSKLSKLPKKYSGEIRQAYKTINRFIEANHFLEKAKSLKPKTNPYLDKINLERIESCRLHWKKVFQKSDKLTKEESMKQFIIEFAFNTTSIEGNTITLKQAQNLLLENLTPKNKTLREIYDLQNTERVFLKLSLASNKKISHEFICRIHDDLLENIDSRKGYRQENVRIFRANFKSTPAPYVKTDMDILLKWYVRNETKLHPLVLGTLFHHKFEKIHPFMDGNGRTGRMLFNYLLFSKGYPPIIIRKKNRIRYLQVLNKADNCPITEINISDYQSLLAFNTEEFYDGYWSIFL